MLAVLSYYLSDLKRNLLETRIDSHFLSYPKHFSYSKRTLLTISLIIFEKFIPCAVNRHCLLNYFVKNSYPVRLIGTVCLIIF